jgi:hypothetical protein
MAKTIKVKNPVLPEKEDTFLTTKYTSGATLAVKDTEGWAANDVAVVGHAGDEQAEAGLLNSITAPSAINLTGALKFPHAVDQPVFRSDWDKISLERKPSAGAFAQIVEGLFTIEWDERDGFSKIPVAAGVDSDTYRWRFYNSGSLTYSDYSGELPGTGLTQFHAGYLIEVVRYFGKIPAHLGIKDLDILRSLNRGQREIDTMHDRWWFALTQDTTGTRITSIADIFQYDLTSDFRGMDVLQVLDINNQKYNLSFMPLIEFDAYKIDNAATAGHSDSSRIWTLLPPDSSNTIGYFGVHPTPKTTGIYFYRRYWRFLPELTSFASKTLIPLPETLINWALFELYKLREDRDNASFYYQLYTENVGMLKKIQRRQIGQAEIARFRGQRGYSRLFGELTNQNIDTIRENYW